MRKYVALILIITLALSLCSCMNTEAGTESAKQETSGNNDVNTDTPKSKKELAHIIVHDAHPGAYHEDEVFFEDENYIYSFDYPRSGFIIVEYTDGSKQNVKEALNDGNIAIGDLDAYNINYNSEPKLIETIIDLAKRDGLDTSDAIEYFYSDEKYDYYFSSIRSHYVIVYFKDGTEKPIKDALMEGSVSIKDLDRFGISYGTEHNGNTTQDATETVPVTINIELSNDVKYINVKRWDNTDGTTKTVLLTSKEDVDVICNALESLTLKRMTYVKPIEYAFELTFLDKDSNEIKIVDISANITPFISFDANCCFIESGEFDVDFLESLFTDEKN